MRYPVRTALIAFSLLGAAASGVAGAQAGLSPVTAGLGLKQHASAPALPEDLAFGGEAMRIWQSRHASDYSLYGGARETPRLGLRATESYGGVVYAMGRRWGSSLEAGYVSEPGLALRRYSLTGQLHAALSNGRSLSLGLKYRIYGGDGDARPVAATGLSLAPAYSLAASPLAGASLAPSYQLQFSYQYSAASSFGLALGRDIETFTPALDAGLYGPRYLTFTGQHWVTPSWALSYDVLSSEPASPLRIQSLGLRLGMRYRF